MVKTSVLSNIPEDVKDNIAKYIVFRDTVYYESEQYNNSLLMSLDKVYYVLIGYEQITNQLSEMETENVYSQICDLTKFYQFVQSQLGNIKSESIADVQTRIMEIINLLKRLRIKIRNIIEKDVKSALSTNSNSSLLGFLKTEYQNL
jgi:hypothetical protein